MDARMCFPLRCGDAWRRLRRRRDVHTPGGHSFRCREKRRIREKRFYIAIPVYTRPVAYAFTHGSVYTVFVIIRLGCIHKNCLYYLYVHAGTSFLTQSFRRASLSMRSIRTSRDTVSGGRLFYLYTTIPLPPV